MRLRSRALGSLDDDDCRLHCSSTPMQRALTMLLKACAAMRGVRINHHPVQHEATCTPHRHDLFVGEDAHVDVDVDVSLSLR